MVKPFQNLPDDLLQDRSLLEPQQLCRRIDALDRLESWLVHHGDTLGLAHRQRIEVWMAELEAINQALYRSIRDDIRQGKGKATLLAWASSLREKDIMEGYDPLDTLIGGVFDFEEPREVAELGADMVFYQPTPARHIFDFIARAAIDDRDVVMDLGSGLGHVTMLTAICTTARCIGIEWQPAYVESAKKCAYDLHIRNAYFIAQDVRQAALSEATVFYLYTPFTGALLREVLDLLKREAEGRTIRLCTLGPCTMVLAGESWLQADRMCQPEHPVLFRSV